MRFSLDVVALKEEQNPEVGLSIQVPRFLGDERLEFRDCEVGPPLVQVLLGQPGVSCNLVPIASRRLGVGGGKGGEATSNRIQSFFCSHRLRMIPRYPVLEKGLTPEDPLALRSNGRCPRPREPDPKVGARESGELFFCPKTHGCPSNHKAFDGYKIILDSFMQLPVILLARPDDDRQPFVLLNSRAEDDGQEPRLYIAATILWRQV